MKKIIDNWIRQENRYPDLSDIIPANKFKKEEIKEFLKITEEALK